MKLKDTLRDFYEYLNSELKGAKLEEEEWAFSVFEDYLSHFSGLCDKTTSDEDKKLTCEVSALGEKEINEFLHVFIIKQVASSEEDIIAFINAIERYSLWLFEKGFSDKVKKESFDKIISSCQNLPVASRLSEELFDLLTDENEGEYSDKVSGIFIIQSVVKNIVSLKHIKAADVYKGIIFPEDVADFIMEGMIIEAVIGKKDDSNYIISSGKVYLKQI
jgi:hypothetical protein